MSIQELTLLSCRLSDIVFYADKLGQSRAELENEILELSLELMRKANDLDLAQDREFMKEYGQ